MTVDPSFVIMAQCYARDAVDGGLDSLLERLSAYDIEGGVDWVQFEAPHSIDEIAKARRAVRGWFSAMKGRLPRALTLDEHAEIGFDPAWYTFLPAGCRWLNVCGSYAISKSAGCRHGANTKAIIPNYWRLSATGSPRDLYQETR